MTTLTAKEAAKHVRLHESTFYTLAAKGMIPGQKIGGQWRFVQETLDRWMSGEYSAPASQGVKPEEKTEWHSQSKKTAQTGTLDFRSLDDVLNEALEQVTTRKRNAFMR